MMAHNVFVPFLGDFLSISFMGNVERVVNMFSSPFLGTFFQSVIIIPIDGAKQCFRPLSWGLSFNMTPP